ncbi:MAG: dienelactone hydrolase family protein [Alphaproteobacteria bacterium]|nr:dienelactone hydrolase family protein [Alphaproteobacteria bacterium]
MMTSPTLLALLLACQKGAPLPTVQPDDTAARWDTPPLESGLYTLEHGGLERELRLHVPADLQPGAPLLIVMHGYTSSARTIQRYTGFDAIADAHGFTVVYPQGTQDRWGQAFFNVGYDGFDTDVDDRGFVRALVEHLGSTLQVDPDAVFATGMSNGGDMSYLLACRDADLVQAIAPVAGSMLAHYLDDCAPARRVPVMEVHGTEDDVTFWAGDMDNTGGWGAYLATEDVMAFWVTHNDLDQLEETQLPDLDARDDSRVTLRRWWSTEHPEEVRLYGVEGGGHEWPGGFGNAELEASEEIWGFFEGFVD